MTDGTTVLIVDDEPGIVSLHTLWLEEEYEVLTAESGTEALEKVTDTIDVVLLDRRMPDVSGDEVLERIREADFDCRVAMVSAVDPDFDVLGLGFDTYIKKPTSREELHETVEQLVRQSTYDERLRELFSKEAQLGAIRAEKDIEELDDVAYQQLQTEVEQLREQVDLAGEGLREEDYQSLFRDLDT